MGQTITVRLDTELANWLDAEARRTGVPRGRIVRSQLERAKAGGTTRTFMRLSGTARGPRDLSRRKGFAGE